MSVYLIIMIGLALWAWTKPKYQDIALAAGVFVSAAVLLVALITIAAH